MKRNRKQLTRFFRTTCFWNKTRRVQSLLKWCSSMNVCLFSSIRGRLSVIHTYLGNTAISLKNTFTKYALFAVKREGNMGIACDVHSPRRLGWVLEHMARTPSSFTVHKKQRVLEALVCGRPKREKPRSRVRTILGVCYDSTRRLVTSSSPGV